MMLQLPVCAWLLMLMFPPEGKKYPTFPCKAHCKLPVYGVCVCVAKVEIVPPLFTVTLPFNKHWFTQVDTFSAALLVIPAPIQTTSSSKKNQAFLAVTLL